MTVLRAIPTRYRRTLYRSKLEADWARTLDALHIAYEYEGEGAYFGDVFYCPDFWLPRSRQWIEVKGRMGNDSAAKIDALITRSEPRLYVDDNDDLPLILCLSHGAFHGFPRTAPAATARSWEALSEHAAYARLNRCGSCTGWWFSREEGAGRCQCCGAENQGGWHVASTTESPMAGWPLAPHNASNG